MPKLLGRSKHKEFESNLAFQIRNQEERIAENRGNWSTCELVPTSTVHPAHCSSSGLFSCISRLSFLLHFFVSSYFNPCNKFRSWFLLYFPLTLSIYQPQFVQDTLPARRQYRGGSFPAASFLHFLSFSFIFLGFQTLL